MFDLPNRFHSGEPIPLLGWHDRHGAPFNRSKVPSNDGGNSPVILSVIALSTMMGASIKGSGTDSAKHPKGRMRLLVPDPFFVMNRVKVEMLRRREYRRMAAEEPMGLLPLSWPRLDMPTGAGGECDSCGPALRSQGLADRCAQVVPARVFPNRCRRLTERMGKRSPDNELDPDPSHSDQDFAEPRSGELKDGGTGNVQRATVIFLGTGTSVGVPALGCECAVCTSDDPRNNRTRCSIVIQTPSANILIDTPPDLRTQLLRERIGLIHATVFTHEHADHIFGLDDLRLFPFRLGGPMPLYCNDEVEKRIRKAYDYAFVPREPTHPGAVPRLEFRRIDTSPFEVLGVPFTPIPMKHGPHFDVLGFRIGDFAYCTDTNEIPESSMRLLEGIETLVIGALREKEHPTHFNVDQAVQIAQSLSPRRTLLTHLSHDLDHQTTSDGLPERIELAYDGLRQSIRLTHP